MILNGLIRWSFKFFFTASHLSLSQQHHSPSTTMTDTADIAAGNADSKTNTTNKASEHEAGNEASKKQFPKSTSITLTTRKHRPKRPSLLRRQSSLLLQHLQLLHQHQNKSILVDLQKLQLLQLLRLVLDLQRLQAVLLLRWYLETKVQVLLCQR